jgi:hypothetical protein
MLLANQDCLLLQRLLDWVGGFKDVVEFLELKWVSKCQEASKFEKLTVLFLVSGKNHQIIAV